MLEVVSLEEAGNRIHGRFGPRLDAVGMETVRLDEALGRRIAESVVAQKGVPAFDRSTVDGFAVAARDTFGCSEALPALLDLVGEVQMGAVPDFACAPGSCARIPTGGQVPAGADAVVMLEFCEEYGDGTVGVGKPAAPGENMVFRNDDVAPGQVLIEKGAVLSAHRIGTLASLGIVRPRVLARPVVGVVSTGDEIVEADTETAGAQMHDVNAPVLAAAARACGAAVARFPIVPDDRGALLDTVRKGLETCDMLLVSGGSSAGQRDNTALVLGELGRILFHGVAVKPGKPTMCAEIDGKPVFGLPGHPVAAYLMFLELVRPLLAGHGSGLPPVHARLAEGVPSNNGRTELVAARLERRDGELVAVPGRGKSGLISQLAGMDGYFVIDRDREGLAAGSEVDVRLF